MSERVTMPALGESVTEGTVTRWLKNVGDTIAVDEPLLEVSTDKVDTEIPSPVSGTLQEILAEEDETVAVGADLAVIGDGAAPSGGDDAPAIGQRRVHRHDGRRHLARHGDRQAQLGGLVLALRQRPVYGAAQAGVAQHGRHLGAECPVRGGVGPLHAAVARQDDQRVRQALHDGLLRLQPPVHGAGVLGQVLRQLAGLPHDVRRRRQDRRTRRRLLPRGGMAQRADHQCQVAHPEPRQPGRPRHHDPG